jgi:ABC-type multidrug transport system permease subunit
MVSTGVFLSIVTFATVAPVYAAQRSVFYREKAASYYRPEAYALTLLWVELPWLALQVLIFMAIFYPMVGFEWTAGPFFSTCLATFMGSE